MNLEILQSFRDTLESFLKESSEGRQADATVLEHKVEIPGSMDLVEMASFQCDRELMIKIRNRNRQLIWEVHDALRRIERGDFGICEMCGDEIDLGRLRAQPVTRMCIHCKRQHETRLEVMDAGFVKALWGIDRENEIGCELPRFLALATIKKHCVSGIRS